MNIKPTADGEYVVVAYNYANGDGLDDVILFCESEADATHAAESLVKSGMLRVWIAKVIGAIE